MIWPKRTIHRGKDAIIVPCFWVFLFLDLLLYGKDGKHLLQMWHQFCLQWDLLLTEKPLHASHLLHLVVWCLSFRDLFLTRSRWCQLYQIPFLWTIQLLDCIWPLKQRLLLVVKRFFQGWCPWLKVLILIAHDSAIERNNCIIFKTRIFQGHISGDWQWSHPLHGCSVVAWGAWKSMFFGQLLCGSVPIDSRIKGVAWLVILWLFVCDVGTLIFLLLQVFLQVFVGRSPQ